MPLPSGSSGPSSPRSTCRRPSRRPAGFAPPPDAPKQPPPPPRRGRPRAPAPGPARNEARRLPGRGRGRNVVVGRSAALGVLTRGRPELGRVPLEEPWVRFFDAPGLGGRHKLTGQAELGEDRLGPGRLIA